MESGPVMLKKMFARFYREEEGGVLLFVGLSAIVLIGFVGMAIDLGNWYTEKRQVQTAADAAAMAAALERARGATVSEIEERARVIAQQNGFTHGTNGVDVKIISPPNSGTFAGNPAYIEAVVLSPSDALFSAVINPNTTGISARAVATTRIKPSCLYTLDPSGAASMEMIGSGSLNMDCGLQVNSNDPGAVSFIGGGGGPNDCTLIATELLMAGGIQHAGGSEPCVQVGQVVPNIPPAEDPFAYLVPPDVAAYCATVPTFSAGFMQTFYEDSDPSDHSVYPGCYPDGLLVKGGTTTFEPGLYIIDTNGLHFQGGGNARGVDLTIYFPPTATGLRLGNEYTILKVPGGYSTDLHASHPDYPGVLFYQDRATPNPVCCPSGPVVVDMQGGANMAMEGVLYFPQAHVNLAGNPTTGSAAWTMLVSYSTSVIGNSGLSVDNMPGTTPLAVSIASLAE